ncbi:protein SMAX1-LIKE 4-like [Mercurialis annua]|uniref:protein SMAX1-LIKE 4-like n=1 Tax=Mercurialis annua TaxID=3986 RepID=UPI00215E920B|nr:protein SMAX1-LIKE 4-like [Mercurialis annua]
MRSGGCTVQQTLTAEAASVLKHSLSLARRRGHAQVTPLHVAATLLSSRASLLKRACLKSQLSPPNHHLHHPLQCRALELCFNVSLNRLPTSPSPLLLHHHAQPSLSNALIAALKRAQAHQRRGCIEQQQHQQQQPLLSVKVELEQLIISILDDPSVSRVMREAGFSSISVKNNIEEYSSSAASVFQCYSNSSGGGGGNGGVFSSPSSPGETNRDHHHHIINPTTFWQTHFLTYSSEKNPSLFSPQKKLSHTNFLTEISVKEDAKLVFEVFLRNKKRNNTVIVGDSVSIIESLVTEIMTRVERGDVPVQLKDIQILKFEFAPVSLKLMKKQDVEMNISQLKRKIDYVGDGGAVIIYTGDLKWSVEESVVNGDEYSSVDHLVGEIGKLLSEYNSCSNIRVWLMGTASYQTYMRCQMRQPSLEIQWSLQAVSVPSGGLGLSLHGSSIHDSRTSFTQTSPQLQETKPFISNGKDEQENKLSCCSECTSSYEKEAQLFTSSGHNKNLPPWLHPQGTNINQRDDLAELRRKWNGLCHGLHQQGRNIITHNNQGLAGKNSSYASSYPWWPSQTKIFSDSNSISVADSTNQNSSFIPKFRCQQPNLDSLKNSQGKEVKITLALGNSDTGILENGQSRDFRKELLENVPWQSETVESISEALIESKSTRNGSWLLIQGNDIVGKRRLALAIAEFVSGSADHLLHMNMRKTKDSYSETIVQMLRNQEKVVVLVEEVDSADTQFLKFLADGFENGKFGQAIFILTKGNHESMGYEDDYGRIINQDSVIRMSLKVNEIRKPDGKRKSDWDISPSNKKKECFSRQSSFNNLDLNIKATEEEDENQGKASEVSPISSDLTTSDHHPVSPTGFLDMIKNRFVFDRNEEHEREMQQALSSRIKRYIEEVLGYQNGVSFSIGDRVIEEMVYGYGSFVNSVLERWLKDIFQKTLETIKIGGKEGIFGIRLCFEGRNDKVLEDGFMGTCLPKKIQVSFMD